MMAIICENCKETMTNGTGRWIANEGNVQFYCATCEGELFQKLVEASAPKAAKPRVKKEPQNVAEVLVKT
jgi:hypothetical protein